MRYQVYRNLHTKNWSIRDAKTKRVVGHADHIEMQNVEAVVSEAGRQRVLRERKKNVHAFLVGEVVDTFGYKSYKRRKLKRSERTGTSSSIRMKVRYNPYKHSTFVVTGPDWHDKPFYYSGIFNVFLEEDGQVSL